MNRRSLMALGLSLQEIWDLEDHDGLCGARTRRGTACQCQGAGAGGRCRWHGGLSTGPRTPEGKARVSAAVRARWARWRKERDKASRKGSHQ